MLGKTGRNFAAGMSGGVAYVYDPDGQFEKLLQSGDGASWRRLRRMSGAEDPEMPRQRSVSVSDPGHGRSAALRRRAADASWSSAICSIPAARGPSMLLDNWEQAVTQFVKVMPTDYAKALADMKNGRASAVAAE